VIEEMERTQAATQDLKSNNLKSFGEKMFATNEGLSKLYEVSCPELDILINAVSNNENIVGARMMGGGFGGCTINIVKENQAQQIVEQVKQTYLAQTGMHLVHYVASIEDGVKII
jgi:galactokinase